jgi:hypothetical protein
LILFFKKQNWIFFSRLVRPILSDRLTCIGVARHGTSPRVCFLDVGNGGALTVPTCETGPVLDDD